MADQIAARVARLRDWLVTPLIGVVALDLLAINLFVAAAADRFPRLARWLPDVPD